MKRKGFLAVLGSAVLAFAAFFLGMWGSNQI